MLREVAEAHFDQQRDLARGQLDHESPHDVVRRRHLKNLADFSGRNVVAYYSGWLARLDRTAQILSGISDDDKNGFMAAFKGLDFSQGLDLIIHSPGGQVSATESIIHYLRSKFDADIRVIVPQISMSGGTMIACSGKEIIMGRHSNLGPIDPQFGDMPAFAVLEEFKRAADEIKQDATKAQVWRPIIEKYPPTFLYKCQNAIDMSKDIGINALTTGMFKGNPDADAKAEAVVDALLSHTAHKEHARHLHREECRAMGLKIVDLENDQVFQDLVLSLHHSFVITIEQTDAVKIIENQNGVARLRTLPRVTPSQPQAPPAPSQPNPESEIGFLRKLWRLIW